MHRATGKTVYEIIKELRGNWSAFLVECKGNIADVDIKEPYDPHANRQDAFCRISCSNWNLGYLQPYEGYRDFKTKNNMKFLFKLLFTVSILYSAEAYSWGIIGHRTIAEIAENHISNKSKRKLKKIIGKQKSSFILLTLTDFEI